MKIALLVNKENFERYSNWKDAGWDLVHLGNGTPDFEKIAETGADALVVDAILPVPGELISKMPGLKLVHSQGVAFNAIDTEAAKKAGVYVCNCAGANAKPVAEQAMLLMLALLKRFRYNEDMVYAGRQIEAKTECFQNGQPELGLCHVGIVGYGAIGRALAAMLRPVGCKLSYYDPVIPSQPDIEALSLDEIYAQCDIISLHVPVLPSTKEMINDNTLKCFKRGAILINTARGELIDQDALIRALESGQLGGFGADTLSPEPILPDNPFLLALPESLKSRVALSPHIAGVTSGSFVRFYAQIKRNIEALSKGQKPECVVNGL